MQRLCVDAHGKEFFTQNGARDGHAAGGGVHNACHQHCGDTGDEQGIAVEIQDEVRDLLESWCGGHHSAVTGSCGGDGDGFKAREYTLLDFAADGLEGAGHMLVIADEGHDDAGEERGDDGLLKYIQYHKDHQHGNDGDEEREAMIVQSGLRGLLVQQFKVFTPFLGALYHPHDVQRAEHQLQCGGDEAGSGGSCHSGIEVLDGRRILDGGREWSGHGDTHAADEIGGREKLAGNVRLAEHGHGQGIHGEHGYKQVYAAQCQDDAGDDKAEDGEFVTEGLEDAVGDAVGGAADLDQFAEQGTQHEQQEEVGDIVAKAGHIGFGNALIEVHPLGQQ